EFMAVKVGINGFGRIGRNILRAARQQGADIEIVAVNDITTPATLAHLLKYDTILGRFPGTVSVDGDVLTVDGNAIKVLAERDPGKLPWGDLGVDIVVESTGLFTDAEKATARTRPCAGRAPRHGRSSPPPPAPPRRWPWSCPSSRASSTAWRCASRCPTCRWSTSPSSSPRRRRWRPSTPPCMLPPMA